MIGRSFNLLDRARISSIGSHPVEIHKFCTNRHASKTRGPWTDLFPDARSLCEDCDPNSGLIIYLAWNGPHALLQEAMHRTVSFVGYGEAPIQVQENRCFWGLKDPELELRQSSSCRPSVSLRSDFQQRPRAESLQDCDYPETSLESSSYQEGISMGSSHETQLLPPSVFSLSSGEENAKSSTSSVDEDREAVDLTFMLNDPKERFRKRSRLLDSLKSFLTITGSRWKDLSDAKGPPNKFRDHGLHFSPQSQDLVRPDRQ